MAEFVGIQYNRTPAQNLLRHRFNGSLDPTQRYERRAAHNAYRGFTSQLDPEQQAGREQWRRDKYLGAPESQWKSEKRAFLGTLNPEQQEARTNALNLRREFRGSLTPEQHGVRQAFHDVRRANVLNSYYA